MQDDFQVDATGYYSEGMSPQNFRKGDYVISLEQPLKRLLRAIFDKETLPDKNFWKKKNNAGRTRNLRSSTTSAHGLCHLLINWMRIGPPNRQAKKQNSVIADAGRKHAVPDAVICLFAELRFQSIDSSQRRTPRAKSTSLLHNKTFHDAATEYNAGSLIIKNTVISPKTSHPDCSRLPEIQEFISRNQHGMDRRRTGSWK